MRTSNGELVLKTFSRNKYTTKPNSPQHLKGSFGMPKQLNGLLPINKNSIKTIHMRSETNLESS